MRGLAEAGRAWHASLSLGLLIALALLTACAQTGAIPSAPPVTRVVSVHTATPTPPPPTASATDTPTPTATASETFVPPSATPTVPAVVQLMAVGDVMLGRTIGERLLAEGPSAPFAAVSESLAQADILAGNLECVITERGAPQPKAYVFPAPTEAVQSLARAGFDVVGLANNHSLDYGADGLLDMLSRLSQAGIAAVGAGADSAAAHAPAVIERNGVRVAFLAYVDVPVEGRTGFDTRSWLAGPEAPGVAWAEPGEIAADVAAARASADVVVVLLHFGLEGRLQVTAEQEALAHAAIDAGAALVLGAHPHVLQPVERYGSGLIAYSLGNFVFDGFGLPANYSAIFSARLTPQGVESYDWQPVVVEGGFPRPATADEAKVIREQLGGGSH